MIENKGIFAVYKPVGPTSHDLIDQLRRQTGERRIGHAGTLDPLASGVLVVGIGRQATRELHRHQAAKKEYRVTIRLGAESTTDDSQGEKTVINSTPPTLSAVKAALKTQIGQIEQLPPIYSAIKLKGQAAHRLARRGQPVELKPRRVLIKKIELLRYAWPELELIVTTGPGVYIRSLARDLGRILKVGGYVQQLERTRVGKYGAEDCSTIEELKKS